MNGRSRKTEWARRVGFGIIAVLYLIVIFADFLGPYDHMEQVRGEPSAPASSLRFVDQSGNFSFRPFVHPIKLTDPRSLSYTEDPTRSYPIEFLVKGHEYRLLGLIPAQTHLFGVAAKNDGESVPRLRLLGADQLGRDKFSRLVRAMRFSLLVTPVGALIAVMIGVLIGSISGYSGKTLDGIFMGATDTMIALPALILILAARAAFPIELSAMTAATMLVLIFGLTGWGEMARLVRNQVWSLRNREFVLAARASGSTESRVVFRHIAPNIAGPVLVQAALMLPAFLLAEVAMSFLGVGLQEPEPSLGNMLATAADLIQIEQRPSGLIAPVMVIMLFLVGIRLLGNQRR